MAMRSPLSQYAYTQFVAHILHKTVLVTTNINITAGSKTMSTLFSTYHCSTIMANRPTMLTQHSILSLRRSIPADDVLAAADVIPRGILSS